MSQIAKLQEDLHLLTSGRNSPDFDDEVDSQLEVLSSFEIELPVSSTTSPIPTDGKSRSTKSKRRGSKKSKKT
jgi:CCR4-NOT transcriptional regulation complex NOT5 subunit